MTILAEADSAVNSVDTIKILKRGVGLYRAAQLLADASRCRQGLTPEPLRTLAKNDAAWYRQIAEQMVDAFEYGALDKAPQDSLTRRTLERVAAVLIEREKARMLSGRLGHDLGTWHDLPDSFNEEAACQRCERTVSILVQHNPLLEVQTVGPALVLACSGK